MAFEVANWFNTTSHPKTFEEMVFFFSTLALLQNFFDELRVSGLQLQKEIAKPHFSFGVFTILPFLLWYVFNGGLVGLDPTEPQVFLHPLPLNLKQ